MIENLKNLRSNSDLGEFLMLRSYPMSMNFARHHIENHNSNFDKDLLKLFTLFQESVFSLSEDNHGNQKLIYCIEQASNYDSGKIQESMKGDKHFSAMILNYGALILKTMFPANETVMALKEQIKQELDEDKAKLLKIAAAFLFIGFFQWDKQSHKTSDIPVIRKPTSTETQALLGTISFVSIAKYLAFSIIVLLLLGFITRQACSGM